MVSSNYPYLIMIISLYSILLYSCTNWVECLPVAWETGVQSWVESYQRLKKWYLIPPCLTLSIIREECSNLGKGVAPYSTPQCSSYWKGFLRVTLDYSRYPKSNRTHLIYFLLFAWNKIKKQLESIWHL